MNINSRRFQNALWLIVIFQILLVADLAGQEKTELKSSDNWVRIESPSKDFSASLPPNYIVDKEGGIYRIYSYIDGVQMQITMEEKKNAKKDFKRNVSYLKDRAENYEFFTGGDFVGMQYNGKENLSGDSYKSLNFASSNGVYTISAYSKSMTGNIYLRFLHSLRLNENPFFEQKMVFPSEHQTVPISSLKIDEIVLKALQQEDSLEKVLEKTSREENEKIVDTSNYSRAIIILRRPRAYYTDSARQRQAQGTVRLKATFLANGQVGTIKIAKSIDKDLDREAFKAARKIKFLPAEVDGKPVDSDRFVEYSFTIY